MSFCKLTVYREISIHSCILVRQSKGLCYFKHFKHRQNEYNATCVYIIMMGHINSNWCREQCFCVLMLILWFIKGIKTSSMEHTFIFKKALLTWDFHECIDLKEWFAWVTSPFYTIKYMQIKNICRHTCATVRNMIIHTWTELLRLSYFRNIVTS